MAEGVLGDEVDVLRKMKIGQIQAAALSSEHLPSSYKDFDVLRSLFLSKVREVRLHPGKNGFLLRKGLEDNGYILLGWSEGGFSYLMSTSPIAGLADLKKAKVWTWGGSPMAKAIFDEAGVTAIPLSIPDVLVGLQTGLVGRSLRPSYRGDIASVVYKGEMPDRCSTELRDRRGCHGPGRL